ncbi:hypothetical protein Ddye_025198 [Dipteronia dyeriana]|uniref:HMA domain-containing protein n=1 Tax=Dipteronia dyeriana TaxID=168575 RepID=A0AAD9TX99_9ROSI|nr:hypothetical protein Ddye_025198 [Dipteronia dyeriana]
MIPNIVIIITIHHLPLVLQVTSLHFLDFFTTSLYIPLIFLRFLSPKTDSSVTTTDSTSMAKVSQLGLPTRFFFYACFSSSFFFFTEQKSFFCFFDSISIFFSLLQKKKNNQDKNENNNGGDGKTHNEGDQKEKKDGGEKKKEAEKGPLTVVLKVDMHCEGCASKIVRCVRAFDGVESVKTEIASNKLTVVGSALDPSKIREKLQNKTKKQVDLISPQPKKDKENDPKPDNKPKPEEKKPKEAPVTTAVLKVVLHCQGCIEKIHKLVTKFKGVKEMSVDRQKDLVTVKGTMDVKALTESLKERLKRDVEIVPPKKEKDEKESNGGGGDSNGGGGKKKNKGGGGGKGGDGDGDGGQMVEEGGGGGGGEVKMEGNRYMVPPGYGYGYGYHFPVYDYGYPAGQMHAPAPQVFSDENPNACCIM